MLTKNEKRKIKFGIGLKIFKKWIKKPRNIIKVFGILGGLFLILVVRTLIIQNALVAGIGLVMIMIGILTSCLMPDEDYW